MRPQGWLGFFLVAVLSSGWLVAADRSPTTVIDADAKTIDMFDGMQSGDLAVRYVPKDSKEARVTIENKTDKPLNVKLPAAFAGMPVLAQAGGGGSSKSSQPQTTGGGMGVGMGGGGGGMSYVAPEKAESFKVPTVCLEYGKAEPRPTTPYQIRPIQNVTDNTAVRELCQMLGTGQIRQRVAQAAAWHLANNMSWEELAGKQIRHINGIITPYFTVAEIQAAMQASDIAVRAAAEKPSSSTPSTGSSAASPSRGS
jgi:hypothetical protein